MKQILQKEKGDRGLIQVIARLDLAGIKVALPISEHLPFDLIAINSTGKLSRVSVKHVTLVNGSIAIPLRSVSTNMKGWKAKTIDFNDIDAIAVYCPDVNNCFFLSSKTVSLYKSNFCLRVSPPIKIGPKFNFASDFADPDVLFYGADRGTCTPD